MPARPLFPVLRAGALAVLGSALLCTPDTNPRNAPGRLQDVAWVDGSGVDGVGDGAPMTGPLGPEQKRPPCTPRLERELMGVCWAPHAEKPPCPDGSVEANGGCYLPVQARRRPPTSSGPGSALP